jgi:hypothetical protein
MTVALDYDSIRFGIVTSLNIYRNFCFGLFFFNRKECPKYKRKRRLTVAALQGSTSSVPEAKSVALNQVTPSFKYQL